MPSRPPALILLPCHSLDDFPVYHKAEEAAGLLASWTSLWHPQLLVATDALPGWHRIDTPPAEVEHRLIVVPSVAYSQLPTGFAARVQEAQGKVIRGTGDRDAILKQALEFVEATTPVSPDLAADFLALGYAYLQVQLLTRHMRYSTKLDELHFSQLVLAAARAALAEEGATCRERLQRCFDLLAEERDHYYPVEIRLIDLVVLPPCESAAPLQSALESHHIINPIASAEIWQSWCEKGDAAAYREAIAAGRWSLIGGEDRERRTPLLSQESLLAGLRRGRQQYQDLLGASPSVFGRRRFGLCWAYPQTLLKNGFRGAWHATLDDGRFPEGLHLKTRWEGSDRAVIDAFARVPQDASLPETFLKLAIKIGEMLDSDHAAALSFVRWPGPGLPWLEDLIRTARYCGAIGRFVSLESFLAEHRDPGISDRFLVDQYKSPYLTQAVIKGQPDPLATGPLYWKATHSLTAASALTTIADQVAGQVETPASCDTLQDELDQAEEHSAKLRSVQDAVAAEVDRQSQRVATILGKGGHGKGHLLLNPTSSVRRVGLKLPADFPLPKLERPVYACDRDEQAVYVVVDIPAMGYVWLNGQAKSGNATTGPALGEEYLLRNDFFEMTVDRHTGGIRSFHEYNVRGNRLSQQLAIRLSEGESNYTAMQADSIRTTRLNRVVGEIEAVGRLCLPDGKDAAHYRQTFRTWRGSRILEIDVHLELVEALRSEPWKSYACQRLVWRDQAADLWRDQLQTRVAVGPKRLEAPQYVEIELEPKRTTLLTGGLTHHRRIETHHLDTLLQVRGETTQDFQLALGLDLPTSATAAQHFLSPVPQIADVPCPPQGPVGWLFHLDARNVSVTRWSTVANEAGKPIGYRVRLIETMGRPAKVSLTGFREAASVRKLDFLGNTLDEGTVASGKALVELVPQEFVEVEVTWAP